MIELAEEWRGKAYFGKIDVDRNPRVAAQFAVQSVPMVIAFKNGQPVANLPGLRSLAEYDFVVERLRGVPVVD
jgi:thioredoxin-like negative regulator of GroEL